MVRKLVGFLAVAAVMFVMLGDTAEAGRRWRRHHHSSCCAPSCCAPSCCAPACCAPACCAPCGSGCAPCGSGGVYHSPAGGGTPALEDAPLPEPERVD